MGRGPGFCPKCGERVTPFAAGCALCGADLDPRRHQPRRIAIPAFPKLPSLAALSLLMLVIVLFIPILGALVTSWVAYDRDRSGELAERNVALALAVLAVVLILSPTLRFGLLSL